MQRRKQSVKLYRGTNSWYLENMAIIRKFMQFSFIIFCAVAITIVLHANVNVDVVKAKQSRDETTVYDSHIFASSSMTRSSRSSSSRSTSSSSSGGALYSTHDEKMDMIPFWTTRVSYNKTVELFVNAYTAVITETSNNNHHISIIVHLHKKKQNVDLACGTMNWIKQDAIKIEFSISSLNNIKTSPLKMSNSSYAFCYMKLEGYLSNITDVNSLKLSMNLNNNLFQSNAINFRRLKTEGFIKANITACTGPLFGSISESNSLLWLKNLNDHGIDIVHFYHRARDKFTDMFQNINGRAPKMYHHHSKLADYMKSYAYYDQNIWYAHCWLINSHRTKWIINIDMDEYLTINNHKNNKLSDYVSDLPTNIGIVNIPRIRYRSCNGIMPLTTQQPTIEVMSCRSELGLEFQKSMYRPTAIKNLDVHLLDLEDNFYTVGKQVTWKNYHEFIIDAYDGVLIKHISPILSNQLLNNHNPKEFLIDEDIHRGSGSLIFQIVKCSNKNSHSSNNSIGFLPILNLCYNRGKMDTLMKLKTLSQYSLSMSKQHLSSKYILVFIDGDEEIINDGISIDELESRWTSFQSDLLVSTELICMLGKVCNQFYNNGGVRNNDSTSIYTGSCIMGTPDILHDTLSNLLDFSNQLQLPSNNINYAFHALAFDKLMKKSNNYIVKLDSKQSIFGSMTYSQPYSSECTYLSSISKYFKKKYFCYDRFRSYHQSDCCTNYDISWKMVLRMFKVFTDVTDSKYKCNVFRSSGLKDNSMRLGTPYFFRDVTASLQHVPLIWTSHGPGNLIFSSLLEKVKSCKSKQIIIQKNKLSS